MDFIIDTVGTRKNTQKTDPVFLQKLFEDYPDLPRETTNAQKPKEDPQKTLVKEILDDLKGVNKNRKNKKKVENKVDDFEPTDKRKEVKEALKKSILNTDFEKLETVPPVEISERNLKKQRKLEREKTKGKKWFGLPATEMTEEIKNDLEILKMRSVLDPKHFYKKNDLKVLPKYFEMGKVMDSPLEFYSNRLTKKERKKTLVDELLADAEFHKYNKRKYKEIIEEKQKTHYKAWRQAKRLKKKK
ncbi:unnamed protein product [Acanthoscelides obtectus]|uniref:Fcf2 pre-rRNA processing C-terminal domain-containing protein n=1 Tax=Acanthoscelides obtectus TaxID=200917 RepID=A0A9P0KUD3_ACAOB|nr:unnamed protein product [Acanthoscelides obtectus]CAK1674937.1 Deoxynucleotidyltransferase terminal-interacting protein 2 [Acanthoscelides obtectus]